MRREGKKEVKGFALVLALMLMISAVFFTEVPVSAASMSSYRVTTAVQSSGTNFVTIKWNKIAGATGYVVYRKDPGAKNYKRLTILNSRAAAYKNTGLKSAQVYQYAVKAYRREGKKNVYTTYTPVTVATVPAATTVYKMKTISHSRINIYWRAVSGADGYRIYRREKNGGWKGVADRDSSRKALADMTVSGGKTYQYCVRPYKIAGGKKYMSAVKESGWVSTPKAPAGSGNSADSGGSSSNNNYSKFGSYQKEVMKKILYAVETGGQVYGQQDYADVTEAYTNSGAEHAITIGAGQWYATEAQRLLKKIYQADNGKTFKSYDKKGIVWKDVCDANWSTYKLSSKDKTQKEKISIIRNIINSSLGRKCQDELMYEQIGEYESRIRSAYKVTEAKAVGEAINIVHQGGYGSLSRILNKTKTPYTLENMYAALCTDPADKTNNNQVGDYVTRQKKVYEWLNLYMK